MDKYAHNYLAEKKAERYFCNVISQITRSLTPEPIEEAINKVIVWKGTSIRYQVVLTTLRSIYGFHIGDYQLVIRGCTVALEELQHKKGVYKTQYFSFYKDIGVAQMAIGEYLAAKRNLDQSAKYTRNKSYNKYLVHFYQAMNSLRAGWYSKAYVLYLQNQRCPNEQIRRQFAIIEAYLHFLVYTGQLEMDKPSYSRFGF